MNIDKFLEKANTEFDRKLIILANELGLAKEVEVFDENGKVIATEVDINLHCIGKELLKCNGEFVSKEDIVEQFEKRFVNEVKPFETEENILPQDEQYFMVNCVGSAMNVYSSPDNRNNAITYVTNKETYVGAGWLGGSRLNPQECYVSNLSGGMVFGYAPNASAQYLYRDHPYGYRTVNGSSKPYFYVNSTCTIHNGAATQIGTVITGGYVVATMQKVSPGNTRKNFMRICAFYQAGGVNSWSNLPDDNHYANTGIEWSTIPNIICKKNV